MFLLIKKNKHIENINSKDITLKNITNEKI